MKVGNAKAAAAAAAAAAAGVRRHPSVAASEHSRTLPTRSPPRPFHDVVDAAQAPSKKGPGASAGRALASTTSTKKASRRTTVLTKIWRVPTRIRQSRGHRRWPGRGRAITIAAIIARWKRGKEQQDWYNTGGRLAATMMTAAAAAAASRRSADDAAGGGVGNRSEAETKIKEEEKQSMVSIWETPQATPFFRVRRRTYKSRSIIGRARGFMKDRTDDLKEYANAWIIDQQYGGSAHRFFLAGLPC